MAEETIETTGRRELSLAHRRRLGIGIIPARRIARRLDADGLLIRGDRRAMAEQIAAAFVAEDQVTFEACRVEDGRDWESFFEALIAFIEKFIPLILMFL